MRGLIPVAIAAGAVAFTVARAQAPASVWDGVFTEEQAARGRSAYLAQSCVRCHGETLVGTEFGPSLVGDEFVAKWNGMSVGDLFKLIHETMPQDSPGRLSTQQAADIVSYVLKTNEFPAGSKVLERDESALQAIKIEQKKSTTGR